MVCMCACQPWRLPSTSPFPGPAQAPGFLGSDLPLNLKTRGPQGSTCPSPFLSLASVVELELALPSELPWGQGLPEDGPLQAHGLLMPSCF